MASILGYVGPEVRGCLSIVCVEEMIAQSRPPGLRTRSPCPTTGELRDWAGELVNQLLGRVKNQLIRRDVTFRVDAPIVVSADLLQLPPFDQRGSSWHEFSSSRGRVSVRLDFEVPNDWQLPDPHAVSSEDDDVHVKEGDLVLF